MKSRSIKKLVLAAMFLALGILLPFLTGQIPQFGKMLLPMHLPVLLCGFVCGWPYGLAVGFVTPLIRSAWLGMPPMHAAIAMAFELAAYGCLTGIFYRLFKRKDWSILPSLLLAMAGGRLVWGVAQMIILGLDGTSLTWEMFFAGALLQAWPGILVQIILIPAIVYALRRAHLLHV